MWLEITGSILHNQRALGSCFWALARAGPCRRQEALPPSKGHAGSLTSISVDDVEVSITVRRTVTEGVGERETAVELVVGCGERCPVLPLLGHDE